MKDFYYYRDKNYWYLKYGNIVLGTHNIDRVKSNIKELPSRLLRGKELIYPDRKKEFAKWMIQKLDSIDESVLDDAYIVMEGMEEGLSSQEAQDLVSYRNDYHKQLVSQYILKWYKKGPEYYMETLPENIKLSERQLEEIEEIRILNDLSKGMQRKLKN